MVAANDQGSEEKEPSNVDYRDVIFTRAINRLPWWTKARENWWSDGSTTKVEKRGWPTLQFVERGVFRPLRIGRVADPLPRA